MQISRHWRLNSQRYRLEGVRYVNGEVRLQARPLQATEPRETPKPVQAPATVVTGR
ncbi:MAG TPA: hypothetical protein VHD90_11375 [Phototrophicaceae bacterium]|nr:hypothetical protein [Phototrophicaceae bacterium]